MRLIIMALAILASSTGFAGAQGRQLNYSVEIEKARTFQSVNIPVGLAIQLSNNNAGIECWWAPADGTIAPGLGYDDEVLTLGGTVKAKGAAMQISPGATNTNVGSLVVACDNAGATVNIFNQAWADVIGPPGPQGPPGPPGSALAAGTLYAFAKAIDLSVVGDTSIALPLPSGLTRFRLSLLQISHPTIPLGTAARVGIFSGANGSGIALAQLQSVAAVSSILENISGNSMAMTPAVNASVEINQAPFVFVRVGTPGPAGAKVDVTVFYNPVP
jgi:hypothetical protein